MRKRFLVLDASRGLAAIGIVIFHVLFSSPYQQLRGLYLLVDFFFVLSGFVLFPSLPQQFKGLPKNVLKFLTTRFFRLWPTVFGAILASMAIYFLHKYQVTHTGGIFEPDPNRTPKLIFAALALIQVIHVFSMSIWIVVPFWSLSAEWFANIFYSPLAAFKRSIGILFGITMGYFLFNFGMNHDGLWIDYMGPIRGYEAIGRAFIGFGLGLLIRKYLYKLNILINLPMLIVSLILVIWNFTTWRNGFTNIYWAGPLFAFLILQLSQINVSEDSIGGKASKFFGSYSYGIYAFHIILHDHYSFFFGDIEPGATLAQWNFFLIKKTIALLAFSVIFTFFTLHLFDKPAQKLRKRLLSNE